MKKFSFSLDTVHRYKGQLLDVLLNELAEIMGKIENQTRRINSLENDLLDVNKEANEKIKKGSNILEITNYKMFMKRLQKDIESEYLKLNEMEKEKEEKQEEVVEMKKENRSLDLLKEKKISEYQKEANKAEELKIEEFVVNALVASKA